MAPGLDCRSANRPRRSIPVDPVVPSRAPRHLPPRASTALRLDSWGSVWGPRRTPSVRSTPDLRPCGRIRRRSRRSLSSDRYRPLSPPGGACVLHRRVPARTNEGSVGHAGAPAGGSSEIRSTAFRLSACLGRTGKAGEYHAVSTRQADGPGPETTHAFWKPLLPVSVVAPYVRSGGPAEYHRSGRPRGRSDPGPDQSFWPLSERPEPGRIASSAGSPFRAVEASRRPGPPQSNERTRRSLSADRVSRLDPS